jgi:HEAT repeat protein
MAALTTEMELLLFQEKQPINPQQLNLLELVGILHDIDKDYKYRNWAANTILETDADVLIDTENEIIIDLLLKAIDNQDFEDVRYWAIDGLAYLGTDTAIKGLLKTLKHKENSVRSLAADKLAEMGRETSMHVINETIIVELIANG